MPRADEYAGAAGVSAHNAKHWTLMGEHDLAAQYTLAARCVRAMAALASGEVRLMKTGGEWDAKVMGGARLWSTAADPLDAITAALGGDNAPR
jgi:hypothetical protein